MSKNSIFVDTVELCNYIGEVNDVATFQTTVISNCFCDISLGIGRTKDFSRTPKNSATLYIFDKHSKTYSQDGKIRTYLPYQQFISLDNEAKKAHWTLNDEGNDYFKKYGYEDEFKVIGFSHLEKGTKRIFHFEVNAK